MKFSTFGFFGRGNSLAERIFLDRERTLRVRAIMAYAARARYGALARLMIAATAIARLLAPPASGTTTIGGK
jgi:hypothetical protein